MATPGRHEQLRGGTGRPGARPEPEVIILTTFDADEHVLRALRAGAAGFVLKDTPPAEIIDAVRRVAQGLPVLSPAVTRRLISRVAGSGHDRRTRARERLALLNDLNKRVQIALLAHDAGLLDDHG